LGTRPMVDKIGDCVTKFKIFVFGSCVAAIMVIVYTNLGPVPIWLVIVINMILFMGIMSRMVPATALNSAVPERYDRGAFMSINSSLQQIAGGVATGIGGMIVVQKTKTSPLQHYDTLGYLIVVLIILNIIMMYRVSNMVKERQQEVGELGSRVTRFGKRARERAPGGKGRDGST